MSLFRVYRRVLAQLRTERPLVFWLLAANVALAGSQFAEPWLFGLVIDALSRPSPSRDAQWGRLLPLVSGWVLLGLFNIACASLVALHADRLSHRRRLEVIARYFRHVLTLPLSFHAGTHSGRVMKVMASGAEAMWAIWLGFFREHCAPLLSLFVLLPLSLLFDLRLGALLVGLVGFFGLGMWKLMKSTSARQVRVNEESAALSEHASDAIGNLPVVQSFTRVEAEISALETIGKRFLDAQMPVLNWWAAASVATRVAATLTMTAVLLAGTWLHLRGKTTVGQIVACMALAGALVGRLEATLRFLSSLFTEAPRIEEFFATIDQAPAVRDVPGAKDVARLGGAVRFEDVSFGYGPSRKAVEHVSFEAAPGDTVALVGATGSGKSTTLALLYRAYDPTSGRVLIDGEDARTCTLDSLRRNIAVVFQEPLLFARSVRENLLVGRPEATEAELWEALERAQAADVVQRLPHGLETVLSERGRSLSGGERQRLSIARALLKAPPILILDEATAALDAITEEKLSRALREVMRDRTTLVIAHRLATVRSANLILVFDHGRIVEAGTFPELVGKGGRFAELARAQLVDGSILPRPQAYLHSEAGE